MAGISRHEFYTIPGDGDGPGRQIHLKRWSLSKFFAIVQSLSELGEKLIQKLVSVTETATGQRWVFHGGPREIAEALIFLGVEGLSRATSLIKASIEEPGITEQEIGEWDLEVCVEIIIKVFEQNLTPKLSKNLASLRDQIFRRVGPGAEKSPAPAA